MHARRLHSGIKSESPRVGTFISKIRQMQCPHKAQNPNSTGQTIGQPDQRFLVPKEVWIVQQEFLNTPELDIHSEILTRQCFASPHRHCSPLFAPQVWPRSSPESSALETFSAQSTRNQACTRNNSSFQQRNIDQNDHRNWPTSFAVKVSPSSGSGGQPQAEAPIVPGQ